MTKRLLIIDDDRNMLEMLNIVFQGSDFDIILSEKGMAGDEIEVLHPDLILLDVQIRGYTSTGDQICKEIKARSGLNNVPVFLISSEPDLDLLAIECKADGFFSKPFDLSKFKSAVRDKLL